MIINVKHIVSSMSRVITVSLQRLDENKHSLHVYLDIYVSEEQTDVGHVLLQVVNKSNKKIFQVFLDSTNEEVENLPLWLHESISKYEVYAYGLERCKNDVGEWNIVKSSSSANLNHARVYGIHLKTSTNHVLPNDPMQESYGIGIDCSHNWRYAITGLGDEVSIIFVEQIYPAAMYVLLNTDKHKDLSIPFVVEPVTNYAVVCFKVEKGTRDAYFGTSRSKPCKFYSYMTKTEVIELYTKAVKFIQTGTPSQSLVSCFYRNKSNEYFRNIVENKRGIMHTYLKNFGGDQGSTLNQQLCGLFFSCSVDPVTGLPPPRSYYGPQRLYIPCELMLNHNMNLYFSDFYCHTHNHKVQLVITLKNSPADEYCRHRLLELHVNNNPFLCLVRGSFAWVTQKVTVEIFFTEHVPIATLRAAYPFEVRFEQTDTIGNAFSMVIGIPKNPSCGVCNLDRVLEQRSNENELRSYL